MAKLGFGLGLLVGAAAATGALVSRDYWWPAPAGPAAQSSEPEDAHDHQHGHGDESTTSLRLSKEALASLGVTFGELELRDYWRTLSMPGMLIEQPGRSELRVTTTVNGIVLRVHAFPGQAVRPGDRLFDVQLTGEALATTQANLLKTLKEIDLNQAELRRVTPLAATGAVSGKVKLDLEYERRRLEGTRDVQMQELLVRGLAPAQIDEIVKTEHLLREFTVTVPISLRKPPVSATAAPSGADAKASDEPVYAIERIAVYPGKLVQAGEELCELAFHSTLVIQGQAFEKEADAVSEAVQHRWPVEAIFEVGEKAPIIRSDLKILFVDNSVQPDSRTFRFYLPLANEVVRDNQGIDGAIYRTWRFKPGQKVQLRVPVEKWSGKLVVPVGAVVKEGLETYVFRRNGRKLDRVAVHVEYEDSTTVVLANDGAVGDGDVVALGKAFQLNLALINRGGAAEHSHAGHSH